MVEVAGVEPASEVEAQRIYYAHSQNFNLLPFAPSDWIARLISGKRFASPARKSDQLSYLNGVHYRVDTRTLRKRQPN